VADIRLVEVAVEGVTLEVLISQEVRQPTGVGAALSEVK